MAQYKSAWPVYLMAKAAAKPESQKRKTKKKQGDTLEYAACERSINPIERRGTTWQGTTARGKEWRELRKFLSRRALLRKYVGVAADDLAESRLKLRRVYDPQNHACVDELVQELVKLHDVAWLDVPESLHKRLPDCLVHADAPSVLPPSLEHFDIAIHGEDGARNGPALRLAQHL